MKASTALWEEKLPLAGFMVPLPGHHQFPIVGGLGFARQVATKEEREGWNGTQGGLGGLASTSLHP